jgi:NitT/TauT family transport system substrate-binding protein
MTIARRRLFSMVVSCIVIITASHARADDNVQHIRLSLLPFSESLGAVIAERQGFFKDAGLEIETTLFASGALALPVLQSGHIDIAFSNTIATLQVIERGLDITVLGPGAVARKAAPDTTFAIMVLKGGIKNLKELEGKRVAVNVIRSATWLYTVAGLDKAGVDWRKVDFIELPNPQQNAALLNNQVDAITQPEPFRTVLMETGKADILQYPMIETGPGNDITQYIALSSWVAQHRDTAIRFARAVAKGSEFANTNLAVTRDINQEFTHLNPAYKDKVEIPLFGRKINVAGMQQTMDLMVKFQLLKAPVDITPHILQIPQ